MSASSRKLAVSLAAALLISLGGLRFWAYSEEKPEPPKAEAGGGKKTPTPDTKVPGSQPASLGTDPGPSGISPIALL